MIGTIFHKNNLDEHAYADAALWCNENNATIIDQGDRYEITAIPRPTLHDQKTRALTRARLAFADKRDAIRWVGSYGFDCAPEDITNFMAAYTPLLVAGEGSTQYKVWLTEKTKAIVPLTLDEMTEIYRTVRTSQLEAYAWYERVRTAIETADTQDTLAQLCAAENLEESAR